jgi:ribosome biogenesis GTPase
MKFDDERYLNKREHIRQTNAFRGKLVNKQGTISDLAIKGTAISVIGNTVLAEIVDNGKSILIDCTVSGKVRSPHKNSTLVAVGDNIRIITAESSTDGKISGRVVSVEQRFSKLSRCAVGRKNAEHVIASNFDNLIILASTFQPSYNKRFIDRLIIASEIGNVKPIIVINKIDLAEELDFFNEDLYVYNSIQVPMLYVSALEGKGINEFIEITKDKISLLFGPSGVGKSTLVNHLIGDYTQQIREISERTNKGQHTTSFVKMLNLPYNGKIIDSPGVREFAMWDVDKKNLALHYHDFDDFHLKCKFPSCSHIHEPGCAVIDAIENGLINPERYESYLNIFDTLEE